MLLSDGEDTASLVSDDQVLDLARKTEINIYAISLRPRRMPDRNQIKFSQAAHLLTALTQDTGGQVHFPNSLSELDAVYDRIAEELRTQYSLGYHVEQRAAGRQVAPHRGARAHARGPAGPPQARLLRRAPPRRARASSGRLRLPGVLTVEPLVQQGEHGHLLALRWSSPALTSWSSRCCSVSISVPSR